VTSPLLSLRAAIRAACLGDLALAGLMDGEARLLDEPPRNAPPLYGVFGNAALRDWSTATDRGHEQDVAIVVWAKPGSAATGLRVAERISDLLDDAPLVLTGHRLVRLAVTGIDVERDRDSNLARVTLRLRAVTEVV